MTGSIQGGHWPQSKCLENVPMSSTSGIKLQSQWMMAIYTPTPLILPIVSIDTTTRSHTKQEIYGETIGKGNLIISLLEVFNYSHSFIHQTFVEPCC